MSDCPFCTEIDAGEVTAATDRAAAFPDANPAAPGHTLVVPRTHERDFFALDAEDQDAVWALVREVKEDLEVEHEPDGWNVNLRVGSIAGQTVPHAHVHLIPRSRGGSRAQPR
ncbi:MAG: HIT family protein [Nitriliruptorales bacterium]|nr:HIT family protein [Nitriliruptorales bacterium]